METGAVELASPWGTSGLGPDTPGLVSETPRLVSDSTVSGSLADTSL